MGDICEMKYGISHSSRVVPAAGSLAGLVWVMLGIPLVCRSPYKHNKCIWQPRMRENGVRRSEGKHAAAAEAN
jgi:ABC-type antimicrobial peptide transport system ATPase subunit